MKMDKSGIPELSELYRGITIDTSVKGANRHLSIAFPHAKVKLEMYEIFFKNRKQRARKCTNCKAENCYRNECRTQYDLTQTDVVDCLKVTVGRKKIGDSENGFNAKMIKHVPAFNRFVSAVNEKLDL